MKIFEKKAKELIIKNYNEKLNVDINNLIINKIISNKKGHIVTLFKDCLLYDDLSEFFIEFYTYDKIIKKLIDLFNYYNESSFIFPNYTPLPESKYIYNNIIKKQRVIDDQENMEELKLIEKHNNNKKLNNIIKDFYNNNQSQSNFFDSSIYNSLLKPCESLSRLLFGIENKKINIKEKDNNKDSINDSNNINNNNNESFIENYNINENEDVLYLNDKIIGNQNYYDEDITEIKKIIKNIYNYEKNKINSIKDNKNKKIINNNKIRVKLGLLSDLDGNINEYCLTSRTERQYEKNKLKDIINNKFIKQNNFGGNTSRIIYKNKVYTSKNNNDNIINKEIYKNQTKNDFQENIIFNENNNPFVLVNYNFKNKNNFQKNITDDSFKHKKIKSSFYINEINPNDINNNYLIRMNTNINDNYYNHYRNELNIPIQYKTQTLTKNLNDYKKNKINDNIFDININEVNIYNNNDSNKNKLNYYGNIPKLDINEISKINNIQNKGKGKEINVLKNKNISKTIRIHDLNNVYLYNNLTERHLIKGREVKGKFQNKNEVKFNVKLGLPNNNKAIKFCRQQNALDRNIVFYTENNHTIRINNGINMNKRFEPIKSNKIQDKNKTKEMISKIYKKNKI